MEENYTLALYYKFSNCKFRHAFEVEFNDDDDLPTVKFQYCRSKSKTRTKHTAASLDSRVALDHISKNFEA